MCTSLLFSSWGSYLAHYIGNFVLALWLPTMSCAVTSGCWKTYRSRCRATIDPALVEKRWYHELQGCLFSRSRSKVNAPVPTSSPLKNTKCTHTHHITIGKVEHCLLEIFACFSIDTDNYTEFQKFQKQYLSKSQIEGCYYLWMYW